MPELTTNLKNILIAAVLAIAAVALTLIYVSNSKSNQSGTSPATYRTVLVAARDIPVGTTGTQLAHAGWLTTRRVPSDAVASGTVPNKAALATLVAIQPTYHGEQIVAKRFGTSQQEGLVSTIHGQLRIFRLPGDSNQLLMGIVRAGQPRRRRRLGRKARRYAEPLRRDRRAQPARREGAVGLVHERRLGFDRAAAHVGSGSEAVLDREERRLVPAPASVGAPVEREQRSG